MRISVSVMAHPDREGRVDALVDELAAGRRPLDRDGVSVAWDNEGPPSREPNRIWRTARRAWSMHDADADWHLLLQDDAVPAHHLLERLPEALDRVPRRSIVSLYLGNVRPLAMKWEKVARRADTEGASWIVGPRCLWGVAIALPVPLIPAMVGYADRQHGIPDDMRVGRWGQRERLEVWHPWPSLVSHADAPSLTGHGPGRTARSFRRDARGATWDGPVVHW